MRIAYLGTKGLPARGGAERMVEAVTRRLAGRHTLTVYCTHQNTPPGTNRSGIRLQRLPALPSKYTYMTSADLLAAWHAVVFGDYDLIHLHHIEASFVLPILRLRYPVVATAHGRITAGSKWGQGTARLLRAMEYPFVAWSTMATSVSREHAELFTARHGRPVRYIPNGVQPRPAVDLDSARALLSAHGLEAGAYWLFAAGRILPLKGAHLLLEAHRQVAAGQRLVIVGDLSPVPEYACQLRALAGDRVTFVPFVSAPALLLGLIQLSSLFVFPSIQEGMSMMLLEAASLGVPLLASDIAANTEVLPRQALYFQSGSAADLADKLRWALDNGPEMAAAGEAAQAHVVEHYSWDVVAGKYEQAYSAALAAAHPNRAMGPA
jgi:glycosyltransferase involved in cell wall biosynthesis